MFTSALMMLIGGALLMLRLSPNGSFPSPLSKDEEKLYVDRWLAGDIEARNALVEHNLRLVAHIIKKYYTQTSDVDDLISIGTIGLIKGINTYRPDKGVRLATYASRCCENEILMHFRSMKKTAGDVSLSDAIDTDSDGNSLSLMDVLAQDEELSDVVGNFEICRKLHEYVDTALSEREERIIKIRYGLGSLEPKTQRETAQLLGISRSYVSRIEKKALEKLRLALGEDAATVYKLVRSLRVWYNRIIKKERRCEYEDKKGVIVACTHNCGGCARFRHRITHRPKIRGHPRRC